MTRNFSNWDRDKTLNIFGGKIGRKFFESLKAVISLPFSTFFVENVQTLLFLPRRHKGTKTKPFAAPLCLSALVVKYGLTNRKKRVKVIM